MPTDTLKKSNAQGPSPILKSFKENPTQPAKQHGESEKFSKESIDYYNNQIDNQEPEELALKFFQLMQITKLMGEEYKEMYPNQYYNDVGTKLAFRDGFTQFKSDSSDYILEHCAHFPLTLVLFYDSDIYLNSIMKSLATKILDVFLYKFESKFDQGIYKDFRPTNGNY